jgi:hypothetical protein
MSSHDLDHQRHHHDQRPDRPHRPAHTRPERLGSVLAPGQTLDRNSTITAMTLADTTAEPGLREGHRLWPFVQGWAAELGLTAPDAIAKTSQPPSDLTRQHEQASRQPDHEAAD